MLVVTSKERTQKIFMGLVCFWTSLCGQWIPVEPPGVLVALPMRSVGFDVAGTSIRTKYNGLPSAGSRGLVPRTALWFMPSPPEVLKQCTCNHAMATSVIVGVVIKGVSYT